MSATGSYSKETHYLLTPIVLEQNITQLAQGPSLFHRHLQAIKQDESSTQLLLDQLQPPETLCIPTKKLKAYKNISLDSKDPLFASLRKAIDLLQTTIFSSQQGKEASQKIIEFYQSYIQEVCSKIGKERITLLKGPAYLSGVGEEPLLLERKKALDLVSLDTYGQSAKSNVYGSSAVKKIGEVYFKRVAGMNPLFPGIEFAVDSLNKILMEEGSTPTQIIKIEGIWIKAVFDESNREHESQKLFAKEIAIGTPSREFFIKYPELKQDYPFKEKRITQIAQASHAIQGINLLEFLEHKENLPLIDPYNFSVMTLLGICTSPSDGRSDNYMVVKEPEGRFKAIGIDNDKVFAPFFLRREGRHYLNVLYAFFLFPQMQDPIDPQFCTKLEKASPELFLLEWISALQKKNAFYQNLLENGTLTRFEHEDLELPITLSFNSIQRIYQTFAEAKSFVKKNPHSTKRDLLYHLSPHLALIYQKVIYDCHGDILAAQEKLFDRKVDPITWETFFGENPPLPPPVEEIEGPLEAPEKLLTQWTESLSFSSPEKQERFLDKLFLTFPSLETLNLTQCLLKDRSFVEMFTRKQTLKTLKIEAFPHLTSAAFFPLIQQNPDLHLILGDKHHLSPKEIAEIIQYAWDKNRKFSLQLGSEIFFITKKTLNDTVVKLLEDNHLFYAEILSLLGADLQQKDPKGNTLLHCFAPKDPTILSFLLDHSLSPLEKNSRGETPLHLAAQHPTQQNVEILIKGGAQLEDKDLNGKTPLHFASIAGQRAIAQYLIETGANFQALSNEKENALHFAAAYGHVNILELLLSQIKASEEKKQSGLAQHLHKESMIAKEDLRSLLDQKDADGKTPLHKAVWGDPKPEIVDLLLQQGLDPNISNHYGYTPLHWAAKHGHLKSAQYILQAGARMDLPNANGDTPIDLALRWGQDNLVRLLIDPQNFKEISEEIPKEVQDLSGYYYQKFEKAYEQGLALEQLLYLEKLGDLYLSQRNYTIAAYLMNSALYAAVRYEFETEHQKLLLSKLERIERDFLSEEFEVKTPASHKGHIANYRRHLKEIRAQAKGGLEGGEPVEQIQEKMTLSFQKLLTSLVEECISLLQEKPPTPFSVTGLGSMSRKEMCPYSDVEFAFILKKDTPENRAYFRKLSRLLELKVINLGETKYPVIRPRRAGEVMLDPVSLTPNGFSMDIGGLSPRGKEGIYELIGDAKALASFQEPQWLQKNEDIILVNSLTSCTLVMGDPQLFKKYEEKARRILDRGQGAQDRVRKTRALDLLRGHVEEFKPYLEEERINLRAFDVKKDFYRPTQMIIGGLALYYGLKEKNTLACIRKLEQKEIFSKANSKKLQELLRKALSWRVKAHLHYQQEEEILSYIIKKEETTTKLCPINEIDAEIILEMYRVFFPLQQATQAFTKGDRKIFTRTFLYNPEVGKIDKQYEKNVQYFEAEASYTKALAINPNNPNALQAFANIKLTLGEAKEALRYEQERLAILRKKYGNDPHLETASSLNHLGDAYFALGKYPQALEYYEQVLAIRKTLSGGKVFPNIASSLVDLGAVCGVLGNYSKAIKYYEQALEMYKGVYENKAHANVARCLLNLGSIYQDPCKVKVHIPAKLVSARRGLVK